MALTGQCLSGPQSEMALAARIFKFHRPAEILSDASNFFRLGAVGDRIGYGRGGLQHIEQYFVHEFIPHSLQPSYERLPLFF